MLLQTSNFVVVMVVVGESFLNEQYVNRHGTDYFPKHMHSEFNVSTSENSSEAYRDTADN